MNNKDNKQNEYIFWALILNIIVIAMEVISIISCYKVQGIEMLQFYTEDSNILMLISSLLFVIYTVYGMMTQIAIPMWVRVLKYISVCCLSITFLVVVFVLAPMFGLYGYKIMLFSGNMLYQHFLCPVIATLSFLLFEKQPPIQKKHIRYALIPTFSYAAVSIILNLLKIMKGPYPFLMVYQQPWYMSIFWGVVILGMAYLISWGIEKLSVKFQN